MRLPGTYPDRRHPLPPDTTPTIGRIVHVYGQDDPAAVCAIISTVLDGGRVLLNPFFPSQLPAFYPGAGTVPTPYSPTPMPGYWTWPAHTKETDPMSESPAEQTATTESVETVAMRPSLNKVTTNIVIDPVALAAEDDEDAKAAQVEAVEARAEADRLQRRLIDSEADCRELHRRAVDLYIVGEEVARCAELAATHDRLLNRYWVGSVVALILSVVAGLLGWDVLRIALSLTGWGLLSFMVVSSLKWNRSRTRLLTGLADLRTKLAGPAL